MPADPFTPPPVTAGVFDVATAIAWLLSLDGRPNIPVVDGSVPTTIPESARSALGIVTPVGATVTGLDGLEITRRFRLRVRGLSDRPGSAAAALDTYHRAIDRAPLPATVNGHRLLPVTFSGSGPTALPAATGRRPESECTYSFPTIRIP